MALSVKDAEIDRLARHVTRLTGETLTEALRERLARERLKQGRFASFADELEQIVQRYAALPVPDARTPDEILGYNENGLPT